MGLITSTGFFQYIPPNPKITSTSSPTGVLGQLISINGEDLDYVDTLSFGGESLNFSLIDQTQKMDFLVPSNPNTGKLIISSNFFQITGQNNLPFLPIFEIENFDPKNGSEGSTINITGKVLTSISTGFIYASPILNDINYYFSGESNIFNIPMYTKSGVANITLAENFNLTGEINNFRLSNVDNFSFISGESLRINYKKNTNLSQKYYENHLLSMINVTNTGFQSFRRQLPSGSSTYTINLTSGFSDANYSVFYNLSQYSGYENTSAYLDSYISGKTTGSFDLNLSNVLTTGMSLNVLVLRSSGFMYESSFFEKKSIDIDANSSSQIVYFDRLSGIDRQDNLYPPFVFTSKEKISNIAIGNTYVSTNLSNLERNQFSINVPNATNSSTFKLNYFTISSDFTNLDTFVYTGDYLYYKKVYLMTGDQNDFQEAIPLENIIISDKNNLSFQIPSTDYHINGRIKLVNSTGISKNFLNNFTETPIPLSVLPASGFSSSRIIIQGKSFKKPILIDSPYQYDNCIVRFRYADNIYPANQSTFETNFRIINKNLLSGYIPLRSLPTGRYAIQMMDENGGLFE